MRERLRHKVVGKAPKATATNKQLKAWCKMYQHYIVVSLFSRIPCVRSQVPRHCQILPLDDDSQRNRISWCDKKSSFCLWFPKSKTASKCKDVTVPLPSDMTEEIREYQQLALPLLLAHAKGKELVVDGNSWRTKLKPLELGQHLLVGPSSGEQFSQQNFASFVKSLFKRQTGVLVNAHLMRDIVVTELLDRQAPMSLRGSYAIAMGQSLETQASIYDR